MAITVAKDNQCPTVAEFVEWLDKSKHTWRLDKAFEPDSGHTMLIKYIVPNIDTRTMDIFNIKIGDRLFDFRDEGCKDKTLLQYIDDEMEKKLERIRKSSQQD
jgi:hypothetical protein